MNGRCRLCRLDGVQDTLQIGKPERLFEQRRGPGYLAGKEIPAGQGDRRNPEFGAASAQHHPLLAAQHEVGDEDVDRRSRQPHFGFDDVSDATTSWPNSLRMPAINSRIARSGSVKRMRAIGCLISRIYARDIEPLMV